MEIDGKQIADELKRELHKKTKDREHKLKLGVLVVQQTPEIRKFIELKQRFGKDIDVEVDVIELPILEHTDEKLLQALLHSTKTHDGIVLQLPLPRQFNREQVLNFFPLSHDVDVIGTTAYRQFEESRLPFLPPVVAAFHEILKRSAYTVAGMKVLVIGEGHLVGAPAAVWATRMGGLVKVATKETENLSELTERADLIMLGAGAPGLLTADMVKMGVIVLDAGTSEEGGVLKGDADPSVAEKAALFTPTPGGIGPITVAKLFENLVKLDELKTKNTGKPPIV